MASDASESSTRVEGSSAAPGVRAAAISLERVGLRFGGPDGVVALDGLDLSVPEREVVAIIGPNGCGKSTLLRVIAGLLPPTAGTVRLAGEPVHGPDPRVALVFQEPRLLPWRSAEGNVRFPMELAGWPADRQAERAAALLRLVGVADFARSRPSHLSGGMRQRIAIARALALEPAVLLLDEPFSALDALTRDRFNLELLRLWERTATTIVVVTHSIPEAVLLSDRVVVMTPRPGSVAGIVRVPLPRPRVLSMLESGAMASVSAEIRRLLVDTTDDLVAASEAEVYAPVPGMPDPRADARVGRGEGGPTAGAPAWFDPLGDDR